MTGSPAVVYEVEVWAGGGVVAEQSVLELWADFPADMFAPAVEYSARVRGVDEFDRAGIWSVWASYSDGGAPGGCGGVTFGRYSGG